MVRTIDAKAMARSQPGVHSGDHFMGLAIVCVKTCRLLPTRARPWLRGVPVRQIVAVIEMMEAPGGAITPAYL